MLGELRLRLEAHARRLGLSQQDSEDVASAAMLRLLRNRERLEGNPVNYALRVVDRLTIDRRRAISRGRELLDCELSDDARYRADLATATEGEIGEIDADLLPEWLLEPLMSLAAHYRDALLAIDVAGQTQEEYAADRGLRAPTVRSRLYRGRDALRALLVRPAALR